MSDTTTTTAARGYTCHGSVRGQCGILHRTREAAERCCAADQRGCASQRGYSDMSPVVVGGDGHLYRDEGCQDWVPGEGGRTGGAARFAGRR